MTQTWTAHGFPNAHGQAVVRNQAGRDIAIVYEAQDAPLIAAVPEMLEVLFGIWLRLELEAQENNDPFLCRAELPTLRRILSALLPQEYKEMLP